MSEANAEDGLFRQERTKYDRIDETNIVFVFSENKPVFPKTGSDRNPLFHSESDIPARSEKENRKWQSGVRVETRRLGASQRRRLTSRVVVAEFFSRKISVTERRVREARLVC